jgi:hypothetical protein
LTVISPGDSFKKKPVEDLLWLRVFWTSVAALLLFLRFPDWIIRPRLWAEDGLVFFLDARRDGLSSFLHPYSGYYHLIPRSIAWFGSLLDPYLVPSFYVLSSLGITLCVVARVFSPRISFPYKPLIALAIIAVPDTGEIYLCPTNVQWIAALSLVLTLLMRDPIGPLDWAADVANLILVGLTGPFCIFLLPLFLVRAVGHGTRASWALFFILLATAIPQGWQVYCYTPPPPLQPGPGSFDFINLLAVFSARVPLAFLGDQGWVYRVSRASIICAGLAFSVLLTIRVFSNDQYRKQRVYLLFLMVLFTISTEFRSREDSWDYRQMVNGDRYFYLSKVFLWWIVVSGFYRNANRVWRAAAVGVVIGFFCLTFVPYGEFLEFRKHHKERPFFPWKIYCDDLRAGTQVEIQVSPGWQIDVPERSR